MTFLTLEMLRNWRPWFLGRAREKTQNQKWEIGHKRIYKKQTPGVLLHQERRVMHQPQPYQKAWAFILWRDGTPKPLDLGPPGTMSSGSEAED